MLWEHRGGLINFVSGVGGVFAEEVTFELDFERRALHRTKSGPSAKRVSLENQSSRPGEGQSAADRLPAGSLPGGQTRPRLLPATGARLSLEATPGLCVQPAVFPTVQLATHFQMRAPCSKKTPLVSTP